MPVHVVWFKRDLRVHDHAPLVRAAAGEGGAWPVVCLWVDEPSYWRAPEHDRLHFDLVRAALGDLERDLAAIPRAAGAPAGAGPGVRLTRREGELPEVLDRLDAELAAAGAGGVGRLWSHEETGLGITFDRDRRVAAWARRRGIEWTEIPQHGVVRRLGNRDGWAAQWQRRMDGTPLAPPRSIAGFDADGFDHGAARAPEALGVSGAPRPHAATGGRAEGLALLESFLHERGAGYRRDMSSPVEGWRSCSRISQHLAWGTLSLREVHHAARVREHELRELDPEARDPRWLASLASFQGRLRWHCHFMQKLESEPAIEHRNMNRGFDGMRTEDPADWTAEERRRFEAWCLGRTGEPMVDACMRCLHATGWLNFRMRAMLVSYAANHLWLRWKPVATHLARHFIDFEPGIHFSQAQMQSGTTGINSVRIYSPAKQARDQDPRGVFIRRWVPELEAVPDEHLAEPRTLPALAQHMAGCVIGRDYPEPVVDARAAMREAKARVFAWRATPEVRRAAREVYARHGSRRGRPGRREVERRTNGEDLPVFGGGGGGRRVRDASAPRRRMKSADGEGT